MLIIVLHYDVLWSIFDDSLLHCESPTVLLSQLFLRIRNTVAHICKHNKHFSKHNTVLSKHNKAIVETQHSIIKAQHNRAIYTRGNKTLLM